MEENNNQSEQIREAQEQAIKRAIDYESMVNTDGFKQLKAYIQVRIQAFANQALSQDGFKSMEEYREKRGEVNGLRNMLGSIESDMQLLKDEANKPRGSAPDK